MHGRRNFMTKKSRTRRWRLPLVITTIAVLLLAISVTISMKTKGNKPKPVVAIFTADGDFQDSNFESNGKWYGLCRKNSIQSVEDFRKTVAKDQALKIHFANFQWEKARMEKLDKPIMAYVNFRKEENIFQKRTPIQLPAGDRYIVDGNRRVRTHCCNDFVESTPILKSKIFESPQLDSPLPAESTTMGAPPSVVASAPLTTTASGGPSAVPLSEFTASSNIVSVAGVASAPPILASSTSPNSPPPPQPGPQGNTPTNPPGPEKPKDPPPGNINPLMPPIPPTPIPEPSTMPLLGIGLAILFITLLTIKYSEWKKKARKSTR
jgi:hypothetical protein